MVPHLVCMRESVFVIIYIFTKGPLRIESKKWSSLEEVC
jgi:hypothetical protein